MIMTLQSLSAALLAIASVATTAIAAPEICPTIYADFANRQLVQFEAEEVFGIEKGAKHVPVLTLLEDGKKATVVVGNGDEEGGVWHPMQASDDPGVVHFVTHIMVKDQAGEVIALQSMDPTAEGPATMTFDVPAGVTEMTPYEWCNLHGFWKGEPVPVPTSIVEARSSDSVCGVSEFPKSAWGSVHADFVRQQAGPPHNAEAPFTEADGEKHTPYITLNDDNTKASILVGKVGGAIHPMNGSPDGTEIPHWITEIYVVDQSDTIVAMKSLDSADVETATMDFEVPKGAESLRAYSWCNLHGLWTGPVVEVKTAATEEGDNEPGGDVSDNSDGENSTTDGGDNESGSDVSDKSDGENSAVASSASFVGAALVASVLAGFSVM